MKYTPGSAEVHADAMILSQMSRALTVLCLTTLPPSSFQRLILPSQRSRYRGSELSGNTKSHGWSSLTAFMKSSVIPTEILALIIFFCFLFGIDEINHVRVPDIENQHQGAAAGIGSINSSAAE